MNIYRILRLGLVYLAVAGASSLSAQEPSLRYTLKGHSQVIWSVFFSPDRKTLASAGADNTVRLWELASSRNTLTLEGHTASVESVTFSPDGKNLASASKDHTIRLWNVANGKAIAVFRGHTNSVMSVAFSPDGKTLASGSWDKTIKLWNIATGKERTTLKGHTDSIASVVFNPNGNILASASGSWDAEKHLYAGGDIRLWDAASGRNTATIHGHSHDVTSLAFGPDGKTLASASFDKTVILWDINTGKKIVTLTGHTEPVTSIAFSVEGKTLASASGTCDAKGKKYVAGEIRLWNVTTSRLTRILQGHTSLVNSVAFSPDGKSLASGGYDKAIELWDVASGKNTATLSGPVFPPASFTFSHDSKTLLSIGHDLGSSDNIWGNMGKTAMLWDVATGKNVARYQDHRAEGNHLAFNLATGTLASEERDHTIKLIDLANRKDIVSLRGHTDEVCSVAFSPDSKTVASGSGAGTLKFWNMRTGKNTGTIQGEMTDFFTIAFAPDGKKLASVPHQFVESVDSKFTIKLWNVATGEHRVSFKGHTNTVNSFAFSPDGKLLVSGSRDTTMKLWDVATGKQRATFGVGSFVNTVAFSPDGKTLASGSDDNTVRLWEIATGKERAIFRGHSEGVSSVVFGPDGYLLVSGSKDRTIKVWNLPSPRQATAKSTPLSPEEMDDLWSRLAGRDAAGPYQAMGKLIGSNRQAVSLLEKHLRPGPKPKGQEISRLIADLDSNRFATRQKARKELEKLNEYAESALRKKLTEKPSLEMSRNIEQLLFRIERSPLRKLRAVEVLEHIGSPEAKQVLENLAKGAEDYRLTSEAKASLERLNKRVDR